MYRILDESQDATVGIRIHGKFTREDCEGLLPYLRDTRKEVGPLNLLFDVTRLDGEQNPEGWKEFVVNLQTQTGIDRVAIAGDPPQWLEFLGEDGRTDSAMKVKNFLPSQIDQAWNWLKGENA
ncbi:MAG: STAS/SEC14 domain-containing protein [Nitrospirales bacterium]